LVEKNKKFAVEMRNSLGRGFERVCKKLQERIWELANKDTSFRERLAAGLGAHTFLDLLETNAKFGD
jgi:hypothetical protein